MVPASWLITQFQLLAANNIHFLEYSVKLEVPLLEVKVAVILYGIQSFLN